MFVLYSIPCNEGQPHLDPGHHQTGYWPCSSLDLLSQKKFIILCSLSSHCPLTHRPRLLLCGKHGQGQTVHLAPAILHALERVPVHVLDLPTLFAVSAKTPEEACAQVFREARRTAPSIIYMPHVGQWWEVIGETLRATFLMLLGDLQVAAPILLLATSDMPGLQHLPHEVRPEHVLNKLVMKI